MRRSVNRLGTLVALCMLGGASSLAGTGSAFAAEDPPIATAASTPPPLTSIPGVAVPDPTADQIDAWLKADGSSVQRPDPNQAEPLTPATRAIHGEVGATVSNRGYVGYASAAAPLGQASELDVAVADGHVRYPHGGSSNPKSLAVGLYLDGRDVNNWLSGKGCGVPRWGVALKGDPQVQADGSCKKAEAQAAEGKHTGRHQRGNDQAATTNGGPGPTYDSTSAVGPVASPTNTSPTP